MNGHDTKEPDGPGECGVCGAKIEIDAAGELPADCGVFFLGEHTTQEQAIADDAELIRVTGEDGPDAECIGAHEAIVTCAGCRRGFMAVAHVMFSHFRECPDQLFALLRPAHAQKPH